MVYVLIAISAFFVAIGFIVNENNAKYLLSGYNSMSKEEKKKFDLGAYIPYFRKFHVFLGISFLVAGLALYYLIGKNAVGIFMAVYPISAYIYFLAASKKYSKGQNPTMNKLGIYILVASLFFIGGILGYGFQENKLTFDSNGIEIRGSYGEITNTSEIRSIELVDQLPKIAIRINGFELGKINKGYFKTAQGEKVKLILNSDNTPIIFITKTNGEKIYYSAKKESNKQTLEELKKTLPNGLFQ